MRRQPVSAKETDGEGGKEYLRVTVWRDEGRKVMLWEAGGRSEEGGFEEGG